MVIKDKYKFLFVFQILQIGISIILKKHIAFTLPLILLCNLAFCIFAKIDSSTVRFKVLFVLLSLLSYFAYYRAVFLYSGFEWGDASEITGRLITDSSVTKSGSSIYNLSVEKASFLQGCDVYAPGVLTVAVKSDFRGICGERYHFSGIKRIGDNFFSAEKLERVGDNFIHKMRRRFLVAAEKRVVSLNNSLRGDEYYYAHLVALKLLTARSSGESDELTGLVKKCGLEYIFALSGMHLNLIVIAIRKLLSRFLSKKGAKFSTLLPVSIYFFFVSRSPSFIRAYIMFVLSLFLPFEISLPFTFLLQVLLYPCSSVQIGFDYSYMAICGIFLFSKALDFLMRLHLGGRIASWLSLSFSAILFSSLISLVNFGSFKVTGILIAPFISLLSALLLCCGAFLFVFSANAFFSVVARLCYGVLVKVLEVFSALSFDCYWGHFLFIWLALGAVVCLFIKRQRDEKKSLARL